MIAEICSSAIKLNNFPQRSQIVLFTACSFIFLTKSIDIALELESEGRMSKTPSDKYLHFTVSLLKGSTALEALLDDALKHHMVDHPGQLIALRLTEYYQMMNQGIVQPVVRVPAIVLPIEQENTHQTEKTATAPMPSVAHQSNPAFPTIPPTPSHMPAASMTPDFPGIPPTTPMSTSAFPTVPPSPRPSHNANLGIGQSTSHMRAIQQQQQQQQQQNASDVVFATPSDQIADEAADYWTAL
jgi:hypothetical protein